MRLLILSVCLYSIGTALGAPTSAPIGDPIAASLARVLRAVPPQYRAPIAQYLNSRLDLHTMHASFSLRQGLEDATRTPQAAGQVAQVGAAFPAQASDRQVVQSVAQEFLERVDDPMDPLDLIEAAEKLMVLGRELWLRPELAAVIPADARTQLLEAARLPRRELDEQGRGILVHRMETIAQALGRPSETDLPPGSVRDAVSAAPVQAGERRNAPALPLKPAPPQEPPGTLKPLYQVSRSELAQVKAEVMEAAQGMYEEAYIEGRGGIFPIPGDLFDRVYEYEQNTRVGFSQLYRAQDGKVIAFTLAYVEPNTHPQAVHVEKIGVLREYRKAGISKQMLHTLALRAEAFEVPLVELLVVKTNSEAIPAYERMGFENVVPEEARSDPRSNAYQFVVPTSRLLARTGPRQAREPPAPRRSIRAALRSLFRLPGRKPKKPEPSPLELFMDANPESTVSQVFQEYGLEFNFFAANAIEDRDFTRYTDGEFKIDKI